ncbi:hypothetical protein HYH02_012565 [Chlamydomonas schloesseri]|uniref:CRC domain-containing protein n=1 Tax=Chlamydomonas schloesseri TaxID=2026947 RepID=A0A835SY72_9CHLO|nr:hypothetical protein HYH02_012565 [Chlamydomonas schloesseri]|eukprot:KAG2433637.1 hypothetical protein HYH02_012565 [Chlamydomonas schloesseri]
MDADQNGQPPLVDAPTVAPPPGVRPMSSPQTFSGQVAGSIAGLPPGLRGGPSQFGGAPGQTALPMFPAPGVSLPAASTLGRKPSGGKVPSASSLGSAAVASAAAVAAGRKQCNCKNSRCLKLYCECFASNRYCEACNCLQCYNNRENEAVRQSAVEAILERNPNAFKPKITGQEAHAPVVVAAAGPSGRHLKGCNCKKSFCLKKYCECFQAGIHCSDNCKCVECRNQEDGGAGGGAGGKRVRYSSAPPAPTPPPASAAAFGLGPAPGLLPPLGAGPLGGGLGGLGGLAGAGAGVRSPTHGLGGGLGGLGGASASGLNLLQQQGVNMGLLAPGLVGLVTGNTPPGTAAGLTSMLAAGAAGGGAGRPGSATAAAAAAAAAGGLGGFGTLSLPGQQQGQQQQGLGLGMSPLTGGAGGAGGAAGGALPPQSKIAQEVCSTVCGMVKLSVINELCQLLWLLADEEAAAAPSAANANGGSAAAAAEEPPAQLPALKAEPGAAPGAGATDMDVDQQPQGQPVAVEGGAGTEGSSASARAGDASGAATSSSSRDLYVRQERVVLEEFLSIINKLGETAAKKLATALPQQQPQQGTQPGALAAPGVTPGAAAAAAAAGAGPFSGAAAPSQQQGLQAGGAAALQLVMPGGGLQPLPGGPAGTPPAPYIPVLAPPPRPGQGSTPTAAVAAASQAFIPTVSAPLVVPPARPGSHSSSGGAGAPGATPPPQAGVPVILAPSRALAAAGAGPLGQAQLPPQAALSVFGEQAQGHGQAAAGFGAHGVAGSGGGGGDMGLGAETTVQVSVVIGVGDGSASDTPPHQEGALA